MRVLFSLLHSLGVYKSMFLAKMKVWIGEIKVLDTLTQYGFIPPKFLLYLIRIRTSTFFLKTVQTNFKISLQNCTSFLLVAKLKNRSKLSEKKRKNQEKHLRAGGSKDTTVPKMKGSEKHASPKKIEARVTKNNPYEFRKAVIRSWRHFFESDDFLLNSHVVE